jgi:hypothetical protein
MIFFDANHNYVFVQHLFILYKDEFILSFLNENNLPTYYSLPLEKIK